jgi:hypothetical protein
MSSIETRYLDDATLSDGELATRVTKWFDLPPSGGTAMSEDGTLYFSVLAENSLKERKPDGTVITLIRDPRLRWVDAPFLDGKGHIFLPVPQLDGAPMFNHGQSTARLPYALYRLRLPRG